MPENGENKNLDPNANNNVANNGEGGADTHTANNGEGNNGAKTFTQEELNQIVQERVAREKKGMPSKEDLEEFNKWKDSRKTIEEKSLEKDKTIEELNSKIKNLECMGKLAAKNVDSKFQKFVFSEVSSMDGDFDTNLDKYLQDNGQYLVNGTQNNNAKSTGINMNGVNSGGSDSDDTVTAILKQKHPEINFD